MPLLALFLGITVKMYYLHSEHNPPHVHAFYGEYCCAVSLESGDPLDGTLPFKQKRAVKAWVLEHQTELYQIWNTQSFHRID